MLEELISSVMLKEATPEYTRSQVWACCWEVSQLLSNLCSKWDSENVKFHFLMTQPWDCRVTSLYDFQGSSFYPFKLRGRELPRLPAVTASLSCSHLTWVVQVEAFSLLCGFSQDVVEYWNTCEEYFCPLLQIFNVWNYIESLGKNTHSE